MYCLRRTRVSWIERKTNEKILRTVKEKCTFIDVIRAKGWKIISLALKHPEEMHNITTEEMIIEKKTAGCLRNSYTGQIKNDARVKNFQDQKLKASNRIE